jgi:hypothetical protein
MQLSGFCLRRGRYKTREASSGEGRLLRMRALPIGGSANGTRIGNMVGAETKTGGTLARAARNLCVK